MKIRKITDTLSARLFFFLILILSIFFSAFAWFFVHTSKQQMMKSVFLCSDRFSGIVKRSTRYSMLLNQKEDVQQIIDAIGDQPGVDGIRIFNKKGVIVFSTNEEELGTAVDMSVKICSVCHNGDKPLQILPVEERRRLYQSPAGYRVLGVSNPIVNEPACSNAACHAHSPEETFLGVLDVRMSLASMDETLEQNKKQIITFSGLISLGVAVLSGLFIYIFVRRRVKKLIIGTKEIADGNLDYRIKHKGKDELARLADAFNTMASNLQEVQQKLQQSSDQLEIKVKEKQAELEKAYSHLVRMEKLASLGKLSATVAHEINNPLAGVLNYTALILRMLDGSRLSTEKQQTIVEYLNTIKGEVGRCGDIVKNMLIFARQSGGKFAKEHLHPLLESSIMLVQHHLELKEINVIKKLECEDDVIICDANQLRQALIVLCVNAIEAMSTGGRLLIHAHCLKEKNMVRISVQDTGCGISEEDLPYIFEPFFSTKKDGKGVGLGLAVVYGIVKRHNGEISVESKLNEGTIFRIDLPRNPNVGSIASEYELLAPHANNQKSRI